MTTSMIRSGSAWLEAAEQTFPTSEQAFYWGERSTTLFASNPNPGECVVVPFQQLQAEPRKSAVSAFDELAEEVDTSPEVREGRRWVAEQFFADESTLSSLRLTAGLSQAELARLCGMEQPHISRYESGRHEPGITVSKRLADALGVSLEKFAAAWANSRAKLA
ncbi:MAG: helix-turn-helix transcriptional regulator [Pseudomonadota bacterium]|nr:helix-turn-helix transcriptional regulator [Pseudomonadota bacterium]